MKQRYIKVLISLQLWPCDPWLFVNIQLHTIYRLKCLYDLHYSETDINVLWKWSNHYVMAIFIYVEQVKYLCFIPKLPLPKRVIFQNLILKFACPLLTQCNKTNLNNGSLKRWIQRSWWLNSQTSTCKLDPPSSFQGKALLIVGACNFTYFGKDVTKRNSEMKTRLSRGNMPDCWFPVKIWRKSEKMETGYCQQRSGRNSDFLLIFEKRQERHEWDEKQILSINIREGFRFNVDI